MSRLALMFAIAFACAGCPAPLQRVADGFQETKLKEPPAHYREAVIKSMREYQAAAFAAVDRYTATSATPDDIVQASMTSAADQRVDFYDSAKAYYLALLHDEYRAVNNASAQAIMLSEDTARECKKRVLDHMVNAPEGPLPQQRFPIPPRASSDDPKRM